MKHLRINMMIIGLLCCSLASALAKGSATITVHTENPAVNLQRMQLFFQDEYICHALGSCELKAAASLKEKCSFVIKNIDACKRIRLEYNNIPLLFSFVEVGDRIDIYFSDTANKDVGPKGLKFSGPGSAKLAVSYTLSYTPPGLGIRSSPGAYDEAKLDLLLKSGDEAYALSMGIVNSYAVQLSNTMKELFRAQVFGSVNVAMFDRLDNKNSFASDDGKVDYLLKGMQIRDSNRPAVVGECPEYLDYLSRRSAFRVVHNAGIARGKSFSSIAKDLISSTTGIIREKALLHSLVLTIAINSVTTLNGFTVKLWN